MRINIKATGMELTEAIRSYVISRMGAIEKLIVSQPDDVCEVEVAKTTKHHQKGDIFRAEVNLTSGGKFYRSVSELADLYAAIDITRDEIAREIKSGKGKQEALFRRGARKIKDILRFGK